MNHRRLQQIGAAGGIAFVMLQLAGQALIQVGGAEPAFNAPAAEILAFFLNRNRTLFEIGGLLSTLSIIAFLWFLGVLWAELRQYEGEPAWLSLIAFSSGLVGLAVMLAAGGGWGLALHRIDEGLSPQMAQLLFDQGNFMFATLWVPLASLLLAAGLLAIHTGALPRWLGWYGMVVAVGLLIARAFWAAGNSMVFMPYVFFWLWLIVTSIILGRRAGGVIA